MPPGAARRRMYKKIVGQDENRPAHAKIRNPKIGSGWKDLIEPESNLSKKERKQKARKK